jgi:hypothetical protein
MTFNLLRRLVSRKASRPARNRRVTPRLEALEDRLAPATHQWTGDVSTSWSNAANWVGGSPVGDPNAVLIFSSNPTRLTSTKQPQQHQHSGDPDLRHRLQHQR